MYTAGWHSFSWPSYATGIAINFVIDSAQNSFQLMWLQPRHKLKSPGPPLQEGRGHQRKMIILRNLGYPRVACADVFTPAGFISGPASSHSSERPTIPPSCCMQSKLQLKRWCRSCRVVHCPPEASSACLATVLFPKEKLVYQKQEQTHCPSVSILIDISHEWLCLHGKWPFSLLLPS